MSPEKVEIDPKVREKWNEQIRHSAYQKNIFEQQFRSRELKGKIFRNLGVPILRWLLLTLTMASITFVLMKFLPQIEYSGSYASLNWYGVFAIVALLSAVKFFAIGEKQGSEKLEVEKALEKKVQYWLGILFFGMLLGALLVFELG
jgi:hypothetical protein